MSTAKHHYMMDCYFPDVTKADGVRRESFQIKASGDLQAISEATWIGAAKETARFEVRKVGKEGSQVIYSSKEKP